MQAMVPQIGKTAKPNNDDELTCLFYRLKMKKLTHLISLPYLKTPIPLRARCKSPRFSSRAETPPVVYWLHSKSGRQRNPATYATSTRLS